jgi:hypothetical protein
MRSTAALLLLACACTRPPAGQPQPRGVQLDAVQLTTWRGAELSARGTARTATLTADGFVAEDVAVTSAGGTALKAPRVEGDIALEKLTASGGLSVKTDGGCEGYTRDRVDYGDGIALSTGPVTAGGCGFLLEGSRLVYRVAEHRAEVFGPVRTRVEAKR